MKRGRRGRKKKKRIRYLYTIDRLETTSKKRTNLKKELAKVYNLYPVQYPRLLKRTFKIYRDATSYITKTRYILSSNRFSEDLLVKVLRNAISSFETLILLL